MKKFLLIICAALILSGCGGEKQHELAKNDGKAKIEVISRLNAREAEYNELMGRLGKNYRPPTADFRAEYKYFGSLKDLQRELESGQGRRNSCGFFYGSFG